VSLLRARAVWLESRKGEIVRAMRDASTAGQMIPIEWVTELAGLIGIDLRKR
jgi:hypothetical protein